ncbi:hypothetical protein QBC39DRAFT_87128 [Podospora conica]|nr:hypothetical protein QBC39DRAFT_87128 [Schizothecium conicum]
MKKKRKKAGQTSIGTHPARAPEGKTSRQGSDHRTPSIQPPARDNRRLCRQSEGEKSANCWASRGYESSTRVGSVAPLRNTKEDDYYRNDSMK